MILAGGGHLDSFFREFGINRQFGLTLHEIAGGRHEFGNCPNIGFDLFGFYFCHIAYKNISFRRKFLNGGKRNSPQKKRMEF